MKLKTTKKAIKEGYNKIIGISYCSAQCLLSHQNEFAYSAGSNGWSCDYYDVDSVCISTGYSYIDSKNVNYSYDLLEKYEQQAEQIKYNHDLDWEEKKERINELLSQFVAECTK